MILDEITLPPHIRERCRPLNQVARPAGGPVVYWMHHAVRAHENPALDAAVAIAAELRESLLVYQGLAGRHDYNNDRHHTFILEGARDLAGELRESGIVHAFFLGRGSETSSPLRALLEQASVAVFEDFPAPPFPAWSRRLAQTAPCPVLSVDASCMVPMQLLGRRYERAFKFREAFDRHAGDRIARPYPASTFQARPHEDTLPFSPVDWSVPIPELVQQCDIDHTVAPVFDTVGGSTAGYQRWNEFLASHLHRYARQRNDAARPDAVSRMSAYLHHGHVSPFRLAREAAAAGGAGAAKYLDELLTWRELAFNFCFHTAAPDSLEAIPSWALESLQNGRQDPRPTQPSTEQMERGKTGVELWDLAQQSLIRHGELHNNVRMTWGKALLSWTDGPETALKHLLDFNHRYALDGSDPNSYGGLLWCLGQFDRPFPPEKPVTGLVRPRSVDRHASRINLDAYRAWVHRGRSARIAVVGGGLAGLTAARILSDHGLRVSVFDKGAKPGGRLATRQSRQGWAADHGAQYFTVRNASFRRLVEHLHQRDLVDTWQGRLGEYDSGSIRAKDSVRERWVGVPGMSSIAKHLSADLDVRSGIQVDSISGEKRARQLLTSERETYGAFEVVLIALPQPQALALAQTCDRGDLVPEAEMDPCWTLMVGFDAPVDTPFDGVFVNSGPLSWIARNSSKPGRDLSETWVLQAGPEWSRRHLESPKEFVTSALTEAFRSVVGIPQLRPGWTVAHRWRYARGCALGRSGAVFDAESGLGLAGDWLGGERVEGAFLSGAALAGRVLAQRSLRLEPPALKQADLFG